MTRDQNEIVLVPEWFGLEPLEAHTVISAVLRDSGGRATQDGTFRLDAYAVNQLRRMGLTIRNRRMLSVTLDAVIRNRIRVAKIRSAIDRQRVPVLDEEHARSRGKGAATVRSRFAEASSRFNAASARFAAASARFAKARARWADRPVGCSGRPPRPDPLRPCWPADMRGEEWVSTWTYGRALRSRWTVSREGHIVRIDLAQSLRLSRTDAVSIVVATDRLEDELVIVEVAGPDTSIPPRRLSRVMRALQDLQSGAAGTSSARSRGRVTRINVLAQPE